MKNLTKIEHHPAIKEISEILALQKNHSDPTFFRLITAYFLAKIPASMKATIATKFTGNIPINVYTIALATSGFGKGTSVEMIEENFLKGFTTRFLEETFPYISDATLLQKATLTAVNNDTDEEDEYNKLKKEFERLGPPNFTFDSGTVPATKQLRDKFLLGDIGAINLQVDEIGLNLTQSQELLTAFLELYDKGKIKQKLTKQSNDNKRSGDLPGETPTNLLLFGTPSKLFDGSKTEQEFYNLLDTGYARRCFFAFGSEKDKSSKKTATQVYDLLSSSKNKNTTSKWLEHFKELADPIKHKQLIDLPDDVAIELIQYKLDCEEQAEKLSEFEDIKKAEMINRYFKVLKLAGVFAFIDENDKITFDNLYQAMKLTEESAKCFEIILNREPVYVKLAKFIAASNDELTHADLYEALPFYKSSTTQRRELMSLATSWGYKNCVIIKNELIEGIEFFSGEALKETSTNELMLSISNHFAHNYEPNLISLNDLFTLANLDDMHWTNHFFDKQHRAEAHVQTGFNLLVIDIDNSEDTYVTIEQVQSLLEEYTYGIYTTKRHTEDEHRFRLIIPIKYILHLTQDDYKQFMNNIFDWLPFEVDRMTNQRSKKWLTHNSGNFILNEKELLNPVQFIPKTSKNSEFQKEMQNLTSLNDVQKWFAIRMSQEGNRNNNLIKYALMLKDSGMKYSDIENNVLEFNKNLPKPLTEKEIRSTVLVTVAKKFNQ